jgi:hypothetical protein
MAVPNAIFMIFQLGAAHSGFDVFRDGSATHPGFVKHPSACWLTALAVG